MVLLLTLVDPLIDYRVEQLCCFLDLAILETELLETHSLKPGGFQIILTGIRVMFWWRFGKQFEQQLKLLLIIWARKCGIQSHESFELHLLCKFTGFCILIEKRCEYRRR